VTRHGETRPQPRPVGRTPGRDEREALVHVVGRAPVTAEMSPRPLTYADQAAAPRVEAAALDASRAGGGHR